MRQLKPSVWIVVVFAAMAMSYVGGWIGRANYEARTSYKVVVQHTLPN